MTCAAAWACREGWKDQQGKSLAGPISGRRDVPLCCNETVESGAPKHQIKLSLSRMDDLILIAAVSQRYGEIGKEQRCAQLSRVRKKEKEDKGEWLFGGAQYQAVRQLGSRGKGEIQLPVPEPRGQVEPKYMVTSSTCRRSSGPNLNY